MNNLFLSQSYIKLNRTIRNLAARLPTQKGWRGRAGFGLNEVIGIAITVMVAALVIAPGIRTFSTSLMSDMTTWFDSISGSIFALT